METRKEMSEPTEISSLDVIFISYDEDNCEQNWADLLTKVPWAKRVHGVEGSDAAHKAAARESETERFISVDADNVVDLAFFDQKIDFEHEKFKDKVVSWTAKNAVNGLEYGNGGLKCWPVDYVLNMRTHEAAEDDKNQVDFCWEDTYVQMNNRFCTTYPNGSPRQAFRAGFREGVKMSLDQGNKVNYKNIKDNIWWGNYNRLIIWSTVGADAANGHWAIYGARLGFYMTNLTDWDFVNVRDFEYLNQFFDTEVAPKFAGSETHSMYCINSNYYWNSAKLVEEIKELGKIIRKETGLEIAELDETQSRFFKSAYINLPRTGAYVTEDEMNELRNLNS